MTEIVSPGLYRIAAAARDQSRESRDAALVAIVFSYLAFEAAINDLAAHCMVSGLKRNAALVGKCSQVLGELDEKHESVMVKISMLHAILAQRALDRGAHPWQDFDALIKLRNLIVHRRPIVGVFDPGAPFGMRLSQPKVLRALFAKKLISEDEATRQFWTTGVQKKEVAEWAVATSIDCFGAVVDILPDSTPREIMANTYEKIRHQINRA